MAVQSDQLAQFSDTARRMISGEELISICSAQLARRNSAFPATLGRPNN